MHKDGALDLDATARHAKARIASGLTGLVFLGSLGENQTLAGEHRVETPVGIVTATLHADGSVSIVNVPSHRQAKAVSVGGFTGDVAYGGNWFFLIDEHGQQLDRANVDALTDFARRASARGAGIA